MDVMKKVGDILDEAQQNKRPFDLPVSYFEGLEERVSSKIGKQEQGGGFFRILKPAVLLACSFVFVLLIGYGVLSVTHTSGSDIRQAVEASQVTPDDPEAEVIIEYLAQNISLDDIQEYMFSESDNN